MKSLETYVTRAPYRFFESERNVEEARLVLLGFPYDSTSSFRVGSRYAPLQLRIYSSAIEGYNWELDMEISDVGIADVGDLIVTHGDIEVTLKRLAEVVKDITSKGKKVGIIGGEHTLTLGSIRGCTPKSLVVFDAHLDFRDEYPYGQKLSHATWLRRSFEESSCSIAVIGVRATSKEEVNKAKELGLTFITFNQCREQGLKAISDSLSTLSDPLYVSVDIDVLDPAYAPGVSNPEPLGFTLYELLEYIKLFKDREIIGFDIVEVCPPHDNGSTCVSACKILMELSFLSLANAP